MRTLPERQNSWGEFYNLARTNTQGTIFQKAIEWKIFNCLVTPITADSVAERMKFHPRNTKLFLNALAGMEIINKKNGFFQNTAKTNAFLVSNSGTYLGDFLLHVARWNDSMKSNIDTWVKDGPPEHQEMDISSGEMWANSARLSAVYQYSGIAQDVAGIIKSLPEFPNMKKMLDLGGGAGFFTMVVVADQPEMRGVIFEQPPVAKVAREFICEYGFEDRVSTIDGNYITDDFQDTYDLIFASATLNFCKNNMDELFRKIYNSLAPGGVFVTHQDGLTDERTKPVFHVTEFLSAELMGNDFGIEQHEIGETMLRAGFKSVRTFTKHSELGDMDINIGRK